MIASILDESGSTGCRYPNCVQMRLKWYAHEYPASSSDEIYVSAANFGNFLCSDITVLVISMRVSLYHRGV